nr:MAG TPA: hypothetical protein [Caudoviricetes sp.]
MNLFFIFNTSSLFKCSISTLSILIILFAHYCVK